MSRVFTSIRRAVVVGMFLASMSSTALAESLHIDHRTLDPLPSELLRLARWVSEYYAAPIGEVIRSMLPLHGEFTLSEKARLSEHGGERLAALESKTGLSAREALELELLSSFKRRLRAMVRAIWDVSRVWVSLVAK